MSLRRKKRIRRKSQGMPTARIGVAATAMASSTASQVAVSSKLAPALARSRAASLAARSGLEKASPTSGTLCELSPAELRLVAIPVAPDCTCLPTSAMVAMALCTAIPTSTQIQTHTPTTTSEAS